MKIHNDIKWCPRCKTNKLKFKFSPSNQTIDGLQGHCKDCRKEISKLNYKNRSNYYKRWRENHKEEKRQYDLVNGPKRRLNLKLEVINHYGGKCECCKESQIEFLSIDHIRSDGAKQRKENKISSGHQTYCFLKRNDYPEGYRVLCHNCNFSAFQHDGICIHKINLNSSVTITDI